MEAYAIFAGGGVKGAAFAGCLIEAARHNIEFIGYGGASAGSLVALLGSIGYRPQEIREIMVEKLNYLRFLGDEAILMRQAESMQTDIAAAQGSPRKIAKLGYDYWRKHARFQPLRLIQERLGLYPGNHLIDTVKQYITDHPDYADLKGRSDITFKDLHDRGAKPLKIIASDLKNRRAAIFSATNVEHGQSVISAIRASTCYPFVFRPVQSGQEDAYFVDGGLASNLPVFLFDDERKIRRKPIIAFDLVIPAGPTRAKYTLSDYVADLIDTALEAGNALLLSSVEQIYHVSIPVPNNINALKFDLSPADKERLYSAGREATADLLARQLRQAAAARSTVQSIQAAFIEPALMEAALAGFASEVQRKTRCSNTRAYVMLPAREDRQMIVYQHGMSHSPDMAWSVGFGSGPSGRVWRDKKSIIVRWRNVRDDPQAYNLDEGEVAQIAGDRQTVYCCPVYEFSRSARAAPDVSDRSIVATLSVDTDTPLENTGWHDNGRMNATFENVSAVWAGVISKLLS